MPSIEVKDVLRRVALLTGAESDSSIASELGVTPQTLATWKSRGKVPYEQLCALAEKRGASLDFLLLGEAPKKESIDLKLFREIQKELSSDHSEVRQINRVAFGSHTAFIYNRVVPIQDLHQRSQEIRVLVVTLSIAVLYRSDGADHLERMEENTRKRMEELEALIDNDAPTSPVLVPDEDSE